MRTRFTSALIVLTICASGAYAETVTFDASGSLEGGSTLGGTFTVDTTDGMVTAVDLTLTSPYAGTYDVLNGQSPDGTGYNFGASFSYGTYPSITILLPVSTLVGYTGGPLCSLAMECNGDEVSGLLITGADQTVKVQQLTGGTASAGNISSVPEPSLFALIALGFAGLALRRKFAHRPSR